jgi:hypothetical protein
MALRPDDFYNHAVITRQVRWDPVIAAGNTSPLRTAA